MLCLVLILSPGRATLWPNVVIIGWANCEAFGVETRLPLWVWIWVSCLSITASWQNPGPAPQGGCVQSLTGIMAGSFPAETTASGAVLSGGSGHLRFCRDCIQTLGASYSWVRFSLPVSPTLFVCNVQLTSPAYWQQVLPWCVYL